jgi:hypothetical protein
MFPFLSCRSAEELNNRIGELERAVAAAQAIAEARALEITALRNKVADAERTSYETIATANVKARNAVMSEGTVSRSELDSAMVRCSGHRFIFLACI